MQNCSVCGQKLSPDTIHIHLSEAKRQQTDARGMVLRSTSTKGDTK